jgi:hypothetical protein
LRHGHPGAFERFVQHLLDGGIREEHCKERLVMGAFEARLQQPTA